MERDGMTPVEIALFCGISLPTYYRRSREIKRHAADLPLPRKRRVFA
jgi:hypothetical protein